MGVVLHVTRNYNDDYITGTQIFRALSSFSNFKFGQNACFLQNLKVKYNSGLSKTCVQEMCARCHLNPKGSVLT